MQISAMVDELVVQGGLLVEAAALAGPAGVVPSCPGWTVADLLRHVGEVHRWAAGIVASAAPEELDSLSLLGPVPSEEGLVGWVAEGLEALVATLRSAPPDLQCWQFLLAPSPLAFWARRQLHETSVHRMDAQNAAGTALSPVRVEVAGDGIDELLACFLPRPGSRLRSERPRSFLVAPDDSPRRWWVGISAGPPVTAPEERPADALLTGPIGQLYAGLWNRGPLDADGDLLALWRDTANVRWS